GHPLAETALIVRGRNRHLLLAPGGLIERIPVGEPLYCWGPGPLYLPIGYRARPHLPEHARRALFPVDEHSAIVLLTDAALRFELDRREPVWMLWVGAAPTVDIELAPGTVDILETLGAADPGTPSIEPLKGSDQTPIRRRWRLLDLFRTKGKPSSATLDT